MSYKIQSLIFVKLAQPPQERKEHVVYNMLYTKSSKLESPLPSFSSKIFFLPFGVFNYQIVKMLKREPPYELLVPNAQSYLQPL